MAASTILQMVPAFILGCILTEIRWIVRMRQLRGPLGRSEPANERAAVLDPGESSVTWANTWPQRLRSPL